MTCYRLVFRGKDRETGSGYAEPSFRCQLPENLMRDGTNKKLKVYLEYAGIRTDGTAPKDIGIVKMKNFANNGSQTQGVGHFEGLSTLGCADFVHEHGANDYFVATREPQTVSYLEYNSFQFNQGKIEFRLENMDGALIGAPANPGYVIILAIKVDEE